MDYPIVRAKERPFTGKGYARKIRALGYLPAVLYGQGTAARSLIVDPKTMAGILTGARAVNTVVRLEIESKDAKKDDCLAIVREYSLHPVKRFLEHCDFMVIDDTTEMTIRVPVRTTGKSEGEKVGGQLNIALREITLKCKPGDVPEAVVIDVSALNLNQGLLLSQLVYPAGTRAVYPKDRAVVTVRMPKAEAVEEEAAPAEGEVVPGAEGAVPGAEGAAPAAAGAAPAAAPGAAPAKGAAKAPEKGKK